MKKAKYIAAGCFLSFVSLQAGNIFVNKMKFPVYTESVKTDILNNSIKKIAQKGKIYYKYPLKIKGYIRDDYYKGLKDKDYYMFYLPEGSYRIIIDYNIDLSPVIGIFNEKFKLLKAKNYASDAFPGKNENTDRISFIYKSNYNGFIFLGITDSDKNIYKRANYSITVFYVNAPSRALKKKTVSGLPKTPFLEDELRKEYDKILIQRYNNKAKERFLEYKNFKTSTPENPANIENK